MTYKTYRDKYIAAEKSIHELKVAIREEQGRSVLLNDRVNSLNQKCKELEDNYVRAKKLAETVIARNEKLESEAGRYTRILVKALEREYEEAE